MSGRSHAGLCGGFGERPLGARVPEWLGSGMDSIRSLVQNANPRNLSSPPVACVALRTSSHCLETLSGGLSKAMFRRLWLMTC